MDITYCKSQSAVPKYAKVILVKVICARKCHNKRIILMVKSILEYTYIKLYKLLYSCAFAPLCLTYSIKSKVGDFVLCSSIGTFGIGLIFGVGNHQIIAFNGIMIYMKENILMTCCKKINDHAQWNTIIFKASEKYQ